MLLHLGSNTEDNNYSIVSTNKSDQPATLKSSTVEKDLGVLVDNKLKFDKHVAHITSKANRLVGLIRRSFNFLDAQNFKLLYNGIVRPTLEYGQVV